MAEALPLDQLTSDEERARLTPAQIAKLAAARAPKPVDVLLHSTDDVSPISDVQPTSQSMIVPSDIEPD
jgi:hypothetical protein